MVECILNESFGMLRFVVLNNIVYFVGKDIGIILGYNDFGKTIKRNCMDYKPMFYKIETNNGSQKMRIIEEDILLRIIEHSTNRTQEEKNEIINWLYDLKLLSKKSNEKIIVQSRQEIEFLDKLVKILKPFNLRLIQQYRVLSYRLDAYIPELNIAIEYDENNHKHKQYTYKNQKGRQIDIERKLGCKFIRITDKYDDFINCGIVLKEINVLSKLIA